MKIRAWLSAILCVLMITACEKKEATPVNTFEKTPDEKVSELMETSEPVNLMTYYEMSDGTWKTDEHTYQYRLELKGTIPNAEQESTFIVLANSEDLTFERTTKAFGFGENMADYFNPEDAMIVGVK